ncbi:(2Fe-2S) ferredoxin domain-containing protein [candidate division KSB1 bacterium]|nr:(2Fe-2S) ferredoxin domain-containing protein [candidate division KSB1 bacterium]NIR71387.1 (2Fe-2S) ferredoxin domain-containing protein [candidate division KSB1 bacterium]NIS26281.1 (2Fe-2S) ferredoxin domain-containing protein [candidate division KSB1 bacterium]NIT73043.1 (2Fe-2S) ferredoxin domain-containing protein [candidate division KSB1 bacterium]NIU26951.1 (2Fe-2S) ferredoxin domain-containing protein [candidate division KSB1 bacterium]
MSKFKQHYFVCINARPPFTKPSCGPQNSNQILILLQEEVEKHGLLNDIKVTGCACLGPCEEGPVLVVYPEGTWYANLTLEDINEIVESHMLQGQPVRRLLYDWPENVD